MSATENNTICLVDGSGYIFRAFYALPAMTRPDGTPINAVYGFLNMLMQLVNEHRCAHIVVVFDAARRNFRNDIYPAYKETRKEIPPELIPQFPIIREVCHVMNIPQIEMEGFEADDLIATYTRLAHQKGWHVQIISADKDLMQLIRENVCLYDPMKRKEINEQDVLAKFGVSPDKVVDVQALMGDSTDNVPGANGVGPKTAAELINQFGSVENVYTHLDKIKSLKRREGLERDKEQVFISKKLVQLNDKVPVSVPLENFVAKLPDKTLLYQFLKKNNFKSLIIKINNWLQKQSDFLEDSLPDADKTLTTHSTPPPTEIKEISLPLFDATEQISTKFEVPHVEYIQNDTQWQTCRQIIQKQKEFTFQLYTNHTPTLLTGMAIAVGEHLFYIPLKTNSETIETDLFLFQKQTADDVSTPVILTQLIDWIQDKTIHVISYHLKNNLHHLYRETQKLIQPIYFDDILIQNYILNGTKESSALSEMSLRELGYEIPVQANSQCQSVSIEENEPDKQNIPVQVYEVAIIKQLYIHFEKRLKQENQLKVYQDIDLPLLPILFKMETAGILLDKQQLNRLNLQFTQEIDQTVNQIYELAGEEFNVNSPVQIATILFDKMGLTSGRKNAAGRHSTDMKVLEKLADNGVEIARLILKYRLYGKLKSTYIDSLLHLSDKNNRVHTTFLQTITNTGRLSSADPNLQNIPIRTPEGKEIRKAFIARPGYKIVCADYSQIELRLMADVAHVKQLKESFINNEDIHARTASQIFKIPLTEIDSDTRRRAKAINFGIIYGISAFGLSNQLGISRADSSAYIQSYFNHYPEIKAYMEQIESFVKTNGYVKTPFGRTCYIPGIDHPKTRAFAIRAAINAPIQGGAADIIKLAMKEIDTALSKNNLNATLLLQIHDELVFEVHESDIEKAISVIKEKMENAVQLSVPLIADVRAGNNWKEAH